ADSARTVSLSMHQVFGTGGSPSADVQVATTNCSVTTSWQRFTLVGDAASISGKTIGSNADDSFEFRLGLPVNTTMTVDVAQAQAERGPYVTAFEGLGSAPFGGRIARSQSRASALALLNLTPFATVTPTDGVFLVGDGTTWVGESGATARTSMGAAGLAD